MSKATLLLPLLLLVGCSAPLNSPTDSSGWKRRVGVEQVCRPHGGISQISGDAGYGFVLLCRDGSLWQQ